MNKILFSLLAALFLTIQTEAALPPLYHSAREIRAILDCPEIMQALPSGQLIDHIKAVNIDENLCYLISTPSKSILVKFHYIPSDKIGPGDFTMEFEEVFSE